MRKILVIADHGRVSRYALNALDRITGCDEISVLSCTNSRSSRRPVRHGLYYLLNMASIRNPLSRRVALGEGAKRIAQTIVFEAEYEGAWQRFPAPVLDKIAGLKPDFILKFGMNLLKVPPPDRLAAPILSYHHGDPDHFRGRPAGFYEMLKGRPTMGQIVQILSNRLDAGAVVAFAETKVRPHSYRATLIEAYRHSPLLIEAALGNAAAGITLAKGAAGPNYRLPSNWTVARFVVRMGRAAVKRLFYGAFFEKNWRVSVAPCPAERLDEVLRGETFPAPSEWQTIGPLPGYRFYADPFFSFAPKGILVEALSGRTGRGEILLVEGARQTRVSAGGGHYSYPSTLIVEGQQIVLPEAAQWSAPKAYGLEGGAMKELAALDVEQGQKMLDPTLVDHDGHLYLFGNSGAAGHNVLQLWSSPSLDRPFRLHPSSPIRIGPWGARMAGAILKRKGAMVRLGQNFLGDYGDGLIAFRIDELSRTGFRETCLGEIRLGDRRGPHTLNWHDGQIVFDWYRDRFSLLAGLRRFRARAGH